MPPRIHWFLCNNQQSSHLLHALYRDSILVLVYNILFSPKTCAKSNHLIQFKDICSKAGKMEQLLQGILEATVIFIKGLVVSCYPLMNFCCGSPKRFEMMSLDLELRSIIRLVRFEITNIIQHKSTTRGASAKNCKSTRTRKST